MLLIHFAENCTIKKTTVEKLCKTHNHLKTRSLDNSYIHGRPMQGFFIGGAGGALPPLKLVQIWYVY